MSHKKPLIPAPIVISLVLIGVLLLPTPITYFFLSISLIVSCLTLVLSCMANLAYKYREELFSNGKPALERLVISAGFAFQEGMDGLRKNFSGRGFDPDYNIGLALGIYCLHLLVGLVTPFPVAAFMVISTTLIQLYSIHKNADVTDFKEYKKPETLLNALITKQDVVEDMVQSVKETPVFIERNLTKIFGKF